MQTVEFQNLIEYLKDGNYKGSESECKELLKIGIKREDIILKAIHPAMEALDSKCTSSEFNLLELMLTGRAVSVVIDLLYKDFEPPLSTKETIVLAALEGDIHDLGKNIVKTVLIGKGYRVIDCGKDVEVEVVVNYALKERASAICISGLISSVVPIVKDVKSELIKKDKGDILVLAGGAALKQLSKEELNVDYVGESAFDAGKFLDKALGYSYE